MILEKGPTTELAVFQADGSGKTLINLEAAPIWIYPTTDGDRITWESGTCISIVQCTSSGAWLTDLSMTQTTNLKGMSRPSIAPNGKVVAYSSPLDQNKSNLAFLYLPGGNTRKYPLQGDVIADLSWQPNGPWLAVNLDVRSDYSGKVTEGYYFLVNSLDLSVRQLQPVPVLMNQKIIWSPDGTKLVWLGTTWMDTSYFINLWEVNAVSGQEIDLSDSLGIMATDYIFVRGAAWLGQP